MDRVYEPGTEDRERLREPRGEVVEGDALLQALEQRTFYRCIAVGDRVSLDLVETGLPPDIAIVDGRIQRGQIDTTRLDAIPADCTVTAANPAGGVTLEGWRTVREAVGRTCPTMVRVDGEEDLLALPAVAFAEPASLVVYGQRDTGAVIMEAAAVKPFVESLVGRRSYDHVIVGGSWDALHAGHRSLLLAAFARGDRVDIGITSDTYVEKTADRDTVASFEDRRNAVERFLDRFGLDERARLVRVDGFRGNAVEEGDALVVTPENRERGETINAERQETGREPLDLIEVPLVTAEDGVPISSSRIRAGEIDGNGRHPQNS